MENLINLFFPNKCIFCSLGVGSFCKSCLDLCKLLRSQKFVLRSGLLVYAVFEYEGLVRLCLKKSKYGRKYFQALKILANVGFAQLPKAFGGFQVIPVPMSKNKLAKRGFNQAEIIARAFCKSSGLLYKERQVLVRSRDTKAQFENKVADRFKNLEGAFAVGKDFVKGSKYLIVDDVCTSGATLTECSEVLLDAGAKEVAAITLGRTLKKK
jgi:ComF family protein